jgi:hypothetical protein
MRAAGGTPLQQRSLVEWRSQSESGQGGSHVPFLVRRKRSGRRPAHVCRNREVGRFVFDTPIPTTIEQPSAQSTTIPLRRGASPGTENGPAPLIGRRRLTDPAPPAPCSREPRSPIVECRRIRQKGGEGYAMARTVVSATSSSPRRCSPRTRTALCVEEASHGRVEGWAKRRARRGESALG